MTASRLLEVIDGLVTVFQAAPALDGVEIVASAQILPHGDREHVFIGWDADEENIAEVFATSTVEWPGPGPNSRIEDGTVECMVSVWTGDQTAMDTIRTRAFTILGACEDALRANPSLSSSVALQAKITAVDLRAWQNSEGCTALAPFTVTFMSSV